MELINDELRKKFEQYPLGSQDGVRARRKQPIWSQLKSPI